jgi:hypothetical protein
MRVGRREVPECDRRIEIREFARSRGVAAMRSDVALLPFRTATAAEASHVGAWAVGAELVRE